MRRQHLSICGPQQALETAYATFAALHRADDPLVLVNAWDAGSARAVVAAGSPAVATGSWAVADAHGYADGEQIPLDLALANLKRIVAAVDVPVSLDLERGYGNDAETVGHSVAAARDAGAVGCNLEDAEPGDEARRPVAVAADRLRAARAAAGTAFWINARTDVFLQSPPDRHAAGIDEALERGHAYAEAGGSSLFVPGLTDPDLVRRVVAEQPLPVSVLATRAEQVDALRGLGVVRVSMGSAPYRAALDALRAVVTATTR